MPTACQSHANSITPGVIATSATSQHRVLWEGNFSFCPFFLQQPLGAESDELQRTPGNLEETIRIVVDHLKYLKPSKTLNILHETKQDFIVLQGLRCFNVFFQEFVVRKLVKSQAVEATPSGTAGKVVRGGKQH